MALHPDSLNIISLCTGGGGLDLGIELAIPDARSVVLVEGEAWSVATLVSAMESCLMAPAPVWSNVRTFDGRPWRGLVDGLIGGIPCQPHSLAGRKGGQNDERDLWSPARRIVAQARPWFVVIENVRGMLSPGDDEIAGAERVWRDLQRLGYAVEVGLFTAAEVGASHERERVFILGVANADSGQSIDLCVGRDTWPQRQAIAGIRRELADASSEGRWGVSIQQGEQDEAGADIKRSCAELDNAIGGRRTAGRQDHGSNERHESDATGGDDMGNAMRAGLHAGSHRGIHSGEEISGTRDEDIDRPSIAVVNAISGGHDGQSQDAIGGSIGRDAFERSSGNTFSPMDNTASDRNERVLRDEEQAECAASSDINIIKSDEGGWRPNGLDASRDIGLYPPGPSDLDSWRRVLTHSPHLEPAVRRMADGVAARLDLTGPHAARIERLRMLGNGVVPLQAAYAIRTLATRLARRSAGAARLVRMMVTA